MNTAKEKIMKRLVFTVLMLICLSSFGQTWEQIGPKGGYFKEFTFHPTDPTIVYAGSDDGGGIWKSTNSGQDWALTTADFPNMTGWSITVDANNPNTVFACDVYGRYGLLKSTDAGSSWSQSVTGLSTQYELMVSGLTMKTTDTVFISTGEGANTSPPRPGNGVFISYDGGGSWNPAGLQGQTVLSIGNNVFGTIFAGTEGNGLQFTNDNGANWFPHPQVTSSAVIYEVEVMDSVIVVSGSAGVYLSTNWGIDFTNTGLAGDFNFDVAIQRIVPTIDLVGSSFSGLQMYSSATGNWNVVADPLLNNKLPIGIGTADMNIFVGTFSNGPIVLSNDDGSTWSTVANSPTATELNALTVDSNDPSRMHTSLLGTYNIGGNYNDPCLYETTDGGVSWTRKGPAAHGICLTPNPLEYDKSFLGTFSKGLFRSHDGFNTYTNLISGNKLIGDIAVSSTDTNVVIVSEVDLDLIQVAIKRSADGGNTFSVVSNIVGNRLLFNPDDNDTVYAATDNGIHLSTDQGVTWSAWQLAGTNVQSLAYGEALYAGTETGILYKIEASSVTDISGNWPVPIQVKNIYKAGGDLFVGLNGAEQDTSVVLNGSLWTTGDEGVSWTDLTSDMTSTNVYGNKVIASAQGALLVGTYGGGIFSAIGLLASLDPLESINDPLQLFPNPTADFLRVHTGQEKVVSFMVLDMQGKVVSRGKPTQPGDAEERLDLSKLKPGMYTVVLSMSNQQTQFRKVVKQ